MITAFLDLGIESAIDENDEKGNAHELSDETIEGDDYIAIHDDQLTSRTLFWYSHSEAISNE